MFPELDTIITTITDNVKVSQDRYFAQKERHWQGISIPSVIPDGVVELDYNPAIRPHYQQENWNDLGLALSAKLPVQITVHQYKTPLNEWGWQIFFRIKKGDDVYRKKIGFGVEAQERTEDWSIQSIF